ncbi:MAG: mannose-1-phosphate guanylyltransferase [Patescibacteria group bacterium]
MNHNYAVILAGGGGTRLVPMSTDGRPKQFIDLLNCGRTMIQLTFDRLEKIMPAKDIFIVANGCYLKLIHEQLPQIKQQNIFLELFKKNTAPAIAYAAYKIFQKDLEAKLLICPSDHFISPDEEFIKNVNQAFDFVVANDVLLTLGVKPASPHTGYGYINFETGENKIKKVVRFTEKPDSETAKKFLETGNYFWNAGIFVWSAKTILEALGKYVPELNQKFTQVEFGSDREDPAINKIFEEITPISIDYAVLEKAENVFVLPADFKWTDLGSWRAIFDKLKKSNKTKIVLDKKWLICPADNQNLDEIKFRNIKYQIIDQQDGLLIGQRISKNYAKL